MGRLFRGDFFPKSQWPYGGVQRPALAREECDLIQCFVLAVRETFASRGLATYLRRSRDARRTDAIQTTFLGGAPDAV